MLFTGLRAGLEVDGVAASFFQAAWVLSINCLAWIFSARVIVVEGGVNVEVSLECSAIDDSRRQADCDGEDSGEVHCEYWLSLSQEVELSVSCFDSRENGE